MEHESDLYKWLESDVLSLVVDMIIYSGMKDLSANAKKWANEWSMYKKCIADLSGLNWFTLKAICRRTLDE